MIYNFFESERVERRPQTESSKSSLVTMRPACFRPIRIIQGYFCSTCDTTNNVLFKPPFSLRAAGTMAFDATTTSGTPNPARLGAFPRHPKVSIPTRHQQKPQPEAARDTIRHGVEPHWDVLWSTTARNISMTVNLACWCRELRYQQSTSGSIYHSGHERNTSSPFYSWLHTHPYCSISKHLELSGWPLLHHEGISSKRVVSLNVQKGGRHTFIIVA